MWPRQQPRTSQTQSHAVEAIESTLKGGDTLPAWNAVWDLVQSSDAQGKQEVLETLRGYVADRVEGERAERAREFEQAIEHSIRTKARTPTGSARLLPSNEVRQQAKRDQIEANRQSMEKIGVRPGEGLPMWVMYMTRRNKRSWR
jgi:hypothetical protein